MWLLVCAIGGFVAAEGALHPGRKALTESDRDLAARIASAYGATLRDVEMKSRDGITLRAWWMQPQTGRSTAVILLHGQSDNRAGMLGNADLLLSHGFAVLLPDARAHGESGGSVATYGVLESADIADWVRWIGRAANPHCVDGLGDSMGAAQVLEAVAAGPRFCAVVAESPFATFREAAYDRMGQQFGTGPWVGETLLRPAVEMGFLYARLRYGVDLSKASPRAALAHATTPVMLIHGLADSNLPHQHSEELAQANRGAVLWEPAGVDHCGAKGVYPEEYERRVVGFIAAHGR